MAKSAFVGEYELGPIVGTGNFSQVRTGVDPLGRMWAVKIVDKRRLNDEHMEDQMLREIAIMQRLRHRNVVELRDVLQTKSHYFIILEMVTGGELFDRIVQLGHLDESTARNYFKQLIAGVHYCHAYGFAHRDLKPENLLLGEDNTLKISDFGLSNKQQDLLMETVCGTPNYVAPEVLKEQGYNGFAADVWSCGIILYVMLAGRLPFEDANMNALLRKIERGEYSMVPHVSDSAKDLIARMIVVDPRRRLTIDGVRRHPWFLAN